jgi:RNA polymerase sigma-70 factor, ECF subfamily
LTHSDNDIIEFTLIFNRYKGKLYNYVLKMISNKMTVEDIIQNIFLRLFENLPTIKNKESINFWLFRSARNEIYIYYRNKKARKDQFNVDDTDTLEVESGSNLAEILEIKETKQLIMNELDKLPPEQKEIFILKEYSGFNYSEIASLLEIDEALVKSRLYKTRQKLISGLNLIYK